jgi:hypothetical protein
MKKFIAKLLFLGMSVSLFLPNAALANTLNEKDMLLSDESMDIIQITEWAKQRGVNINVENTSSINYKELIDVINYAVQDTKYGYENLDEMRNTIDTNNSMKSNTIVGPMGGDGRVYERLVQKPYEGRKDIDNTAYNYTLNVLVRYTCYQDTLGKNIDRINNIDSSMGQVGLELKSYANKDSWEVSNNGLQATVGGRGTVTVALSGVTISWEVTYQVTFRAGEGIILY